MIVSPGHPGAGVVDSTQFIIGPPTGGGPAPVGVTQPNPSGSNPSGVDTTTTVSAPLPSNPVTTPNENPQPTGSGLSFGQVENYWIQAGGNPQAASMAAAVADAESGLNAAAQRTNPDGSMGVGLWLIPQNGTPPGSTDPLANARAAVQLSNNGTDWTQWCSTWSDNNCGENNGTYLGSGSNALMSLQGQKPGAGNYSVFGSVPSSTGVGASSSASGTGGSTTSSSSSKMLIIFVAALILLGVILWASNRKSQGQSEEKPETQEQQ